MSPESFQAIEMAMHIYRRRGATEYRKRQYKRLLNALKDIFECEPNLHGNINRIGRKQLIGYWRRHEHLSQKVRVEHYRVIYELFNHLDTQITVPKPKLLQVTL